MYEWSDEHRMMRDAVRQFAEAEIVPHIDDLEHVDLPPYDILRKLWQTFGMDAMARDRFARQQSREGSGGSGDEGSSGGGGGGGGAALAMIPIIEICRYCPGMVTALGV